MRRSVVSAIISGSVVYLNHCVNYLDPPIPQAHNRCHGETLGIDLYGVTYLRQLECTQLSIYISQRGRKTAGHYLCE